MATDLGREQFVLLTTFKKNGNPVSSPVWIAGLADGRLGFTTSASSWKVKRIRHNPRVRLQPCNRTGTPTPGSRVTEATAEVFTSGQMVDRIQSAIRAKYGLQLKMVNALHSIAVKLGKLPPGREDAVVVIDRG